MAIVFNTTLPGFSKVDYADAASVTKAIQKLVTAKLSDNDVYTNVSAVAFNMGRAAREAGKNELPAFGPIFDAFAAEFWTAANNRPKALTPKSRESYVICFNHFGKAGFYRPYDATSVAKFVAEKAKGAFTSRGATIAKILERFPKEAPTEDQMTELLPKEEPKTLLDVVEGMIDTLAKAVKVEANAALLTSHPHADVALADVAAFLAAARDALPKKGTDADVLKAAADAKRKALADAMAQKQD